MNSGQNQVVCNFIYMGYQRNCSNICNDTYDGDSIIGFLDLDVDQRWHDVLMLMTRLPF